MHSLELLFPPFAFPLAVLQAQHAIYVYTFGYMYDQSLMDVFNSPSANLKLRCRVLGDREDAAILTRMGGAFSVVWVGLVAVKLKVSSVTARSDGSDVVLQLKDRHTHWEFVEELFTARPTILAPFIRCQTVATMSISGTRVLWDVESHSIDRPLLPFSVIVCREE